MDQLTQGLAAPSTQDLQTGFLKLLPGIEGYARAVFAHVRCPGKRDDCIAETIAVAWKWFVRATEQGKSPAEFAGTLATFATRHVRCGRHLCGQEKGKDVLSPLAQRRHGFLAQALPACDTGVADNLALDALRDNTVTPPDEQAAFRIDFPVWMASLGERKQRVAEDLMLGERTQDVASQHKLSPARVSQLRTELMRDWRRFCGEPALP